MKDSKMENTEFITKIFWVSVRLSLNQGSLDVFDFFLVTLDARYEQIQAEKNSLLYELLTKITKQH